MDLVTADIRTELSPEAVQNCILEAALRLGEQAGSWDAVHVHEVAREAGVTMDELGRHFDDKDAIGEAYFDRADAAMLALGRSPGWGELAIPERLFRLVTAWLDTLAPHRRLAFGMLRYKIQPEHIHLQARGVARISRTVQWIRESAMLPSTGRRRELEEAVLTSIYLTTLMLWFADESPGGERSKRLLRTLLARADGGARWLDALRPR